MLMNMGLRTDILYRNIHTNNLNIKLNISVILFYLIIDVQIEVTDIDINVPTGTGGTYYNLCCVLRQKQHGIQ